MQTDLRLAHSLLMWTLASVKWEHDWSDDLRILPATTMPSTAHEEYLGEQTTWMGVHGKSRVKSIVVEEHGAMVLGDHIGDLRQGTVSDKEEPSCTQIICQGPLRCEASKLGSEPRAGPGSHDKICNLVCRAPIGLVGPGRPAGQAVQELGSRLAVGEKMRSEGGTCA